MKAGGHRQSSLSSVSPPLLWLAGHSKVQPVHLLWALTVQPESYAPRPAHMQHDPPLRAALQALCGNAAAPYAQVRVDCLGCTSAMQPAASSMKQSIQ